MPLGPFIREAAGADSVTVEDGNLLTGGAIQENRALTVIIHGGAFNGTHQMVLRAEATATIAESRPLDQQFAFLKAADAGNAQLDELAARAQHLARLFFVLSSPRRYSFLVDLWLGARAFGGCAPRW